MAAEITPLLLCHIWPKLVPVRTGAGLVGKAVAKPTKPIRWLGDSREVIRSFPEDVKDDMGVALLAAQKGQKHADAKPLKGFGGASVLEIVENDDGDTYRAVYTVKYKERIYVLHCFQKKSNRGSETPKRDMDVIEKRLKWAARIDAEEQQGKVKDV